LWQNNNSKYYRKLNKTNTIEDIVRSKALHTASYYYAPLLPLHSHCFDQKYRDKNTEKRLVTARDELANHLSSMTRKVPEQLSRRTNSNQTDADEAEVAECRVCRGPEEPGNPL
jgi:hypothetical protein